VKLIKIIAGHLLVLGLAFPQLVAAEEFVIKTAVDLSQLHEDVSKVRITCQIREGTTVIASGSEEMNIPANGVLKRTIKLKFNSNPGVTVNVKAAMNHLCKMTFKKVGFNLPGASFQALSPDSGSCSGGGLASSGWRCGLPGTQFVNELAGPLPGDRR
jgi:hypothetical protein